MNIKISDTKYQIYIDKHAEFLKKNLSHRRISYYNRVRNDLNALRIRTKGTSLDSVVIAFIEVVKRYQELNSSKPTPGYVSKKHILTDHALCSALSRMYGVDILKVKDRVVEDIDKYKVRHVVNDGLIITVLGGD